MFSLTVCHTLYEHRGGRVDFIVSLRHTPVASKLIRYERLDEIAKQIKWLSPICREIWPLQIREIMSHKFVGGVLGPMSDMKLLKGKGNESMSLTWSRLRCWRSCWRAKAKFESGQAAVASGGAVRVWGGFVLVLINFQTFLLWFSSVYCKKSKMASVQKSCRKFNVIWFHQPILRSSTSYQDISLISKKMGGKWVGRAKEGGRSHPKATTLITFGLSGVLNVSNKTNQWGLKANTRNLRQAREKNLLLNRANTM